MRFSVQRKREDEVCTQIKDGEVQVLKEERRDIQTHKEGRWGLGFKGRREMRYTEIEMRFRAYRKKEDDGVHKVRWRRFRVQREKGR